MLSLSNQVKCKIGEVSNLFFCLWALETIERKCAFGNSATIAFFPLHHASTKAELRRVGVGGYQTELCQIWWWDYCLETRHLTWRHTNSLGLKEGHPPRTLLLLAPAGVGRIQPQARHLTSSTLPENLEGLSFGLILPFSLTKSASPHVEKAKVNLH